VPLYTGALDAGLDSTLLGAGHANEPRMHLLHIDADLKPLCAPLITYFNTITIYSTWISNVLFRMWWQVTEYTTGKTQWMD